MMMPDRPDGSRRVLEDVGDLIDCASVGLGLPCEAFGEFMAITSATCIEVEEILEADSTVAADPEERDLAAVEELVEVSAAHSESLGSLARRHRFVATDHGELGSAANARDDLMEGSTDLAVSGSCVGIERSELVWGDA